MNNAGMTSFCQNNINQDVAKFSRARGEDSSSNINDWEPLKVLAVVSECWVLERNWAECVVRRSIPSAAVDVERVRLERGFVSESSASSAVFHPSSRLFLHVDPTMGSHATGGMQMRTCRAIESPIALAKRVVFNAETCAMQRKARNTLTLSQLRRRVPTVDDQYSTHCVFGLGRLLVTAPNTFEDVPNLFQGVQCLGQ